MNDTVYLWIGFGAFVLTMMALDLGVFHRRPHVTSLREAAIWTVVWVCLALAFNGLIYWNQGRAPAIEFLTGYIIEWSLSMDNVFVFAVIFGYFGVPPQYQHRVLFWGILGAVVMRLTFILTGAVLLQRFHWLMYVMGAFLVLTGLRLLFERKRDTDLSKNWVLRVARRWLPVTDGYVGRKFFVHLAAATVPDGTPRQGNSDGRESAALPATRWFVTPLFLVLLVVETTDVAFAVDSIPAIFAVTRDPFIVFTSNIFAILGLRALYFLLAGAMQMFRYLSTGLATILCFVGIKMLVSGWYEIPVSLSLGIVTSILGLAVTASWLAARRESSRAVARPSAHQKESEPENERVEAGVS